ncbi:MAG: CdaR family protein [Armatimonadia bacterium]
MNLAKRIRHNLGLKALALALALLIWGLVRNQADPSMLQHRTLAVEVVGVPEHLAVAAVTPSQVSLTLYGRNSALQRLEDSGFRIVARVTDATARSTRVQVEPQNLPPGVEIRDLVPLSVRVELDAEVSAARPVFVQLRGNPAEGFTASEPQVRPNEVTISGPSRQVEKVARVVAEVDVSGRSTEEPITIPLLARDAASLLVPGIQITPDQVAVTVPLRKIDSRTVPVAPVLSEVPRGYDVESVSVRPVVVTVTGSSRLLGDVDTVQTAPINLTGSAGRTSYTVPLRLATGLHSDTDSVVVTITLGRGGGSSGNGRGSRATETSPAGESAPEATSPSPRPPAAQPAEQTPPPAVAPPAGEEERSTGAAPRNPSTTHAPRTPARGPRPEPKGTD